MFIETANPTQPFCLITALFSIVEKPASFDHLISANSIIKISANSIIKLLCVLKDYVLGCEWRFRKSDTYRKKSSLIAFSWQIIQTTNNKQQTTNNKQQTVAMQCLILTMYDTTP